MIKYSNIGVLVCWCVGVLVSFIVLLSSCGGGGGAINNDGSVAFSKLESVLPYFMHKTKHDLSMVRLNMSVMALPGISIGVDDATTCKSGSRDESAPTVVVTDAQTITQYDVNYSECIDESGNYQDGKLSSKVKGTKDLNGDAVVTTDIAVTKFINTNYPLIQGDDKDNPLANKLRSIKVAVTGSRHDVDSSGLHTSALTSRVSYDAANNGGTLIVDEFNTEFVETSIGSTIKKYSVSAEWDMSSDASHNKLIRTASFLIGVEGLNRTFVPDYYKMNVKVLKPLVSAGDPGFPVSGSYRVTLERRLKSDITLLTEFNASGAIVTHTENTRDTISRVSR